MGIIKIDPVIIENIKPCIDGGKYKIKRVVGDTINVTADIFRDGHDILASLLKYRIKGEKNWIETPMTMLVNDCWEGSFTVDKNAIYEYTIESYSEKFKSWIAELSKKHGVIPDVKSELLEGIAIIKKSMELATKSEKSNFKEIIETMEKNIEGSKKQRLAVAIALTDKLRILMETFPDRSEGSEYDKPLEVYVDRVEARYASWYEIFPRSAGSIEGQSGTFKDVENRIPYIKDLGFNVLYFPPIHPIGISNRKGKNNSVTSVPGEPGSPYAIGSADGGHKSIHPDLGTFKDFKHLVDKAAENGMEIALDFAINCSPDHPYVKEHPDWFYKRPDGTIKYAENPPKKYEDIYPVNFYCDDKESLWNEMRDIFLFWADKGVKIFRVDNPHTKPVKFWEWCISEVQEKYPDVLFLAEAFTRPKMMRQLAKIGFSQSYSYFTWRNFKQEIVEYFEELTGSEMKEYFRANLFATTPDILPLILQEAGRPAFIMRAVLAGTLSSVYGMYSGYEICENSPVQGKEEYFNSEKYELKIRDFNQEGNIQYYIRTINNIRRDNPALHDYTNLRFHHSENDSVLCYSKITEDKSNMIFVVVNIDPYQQHSSIVEVPIEDFGIKSDETYQVHDLLHDDRYLWTGSKNYIELDPSQDKGAHIFKIRKWSHSEQGFDYYI